jgi:hypothetical protein
MNRKLHQAGHLNRSLRNGSWNKVIAPRDRVRMDPRRMNHRRIFTSLLSSLFLLLALSVQVKSRPLWRGAETTGSASSGDAVITFRKVFKSSYPEFVEIKTHQDGSGTFDIRQLDHDASPQSFEIGPPLAQKIFELADKLHDFQGVDLEVHRRLANLGDKTFRYEKGSETHEAKFNYTLDVAAAQLLAIFESLTRQEMDLADLQRTMRYDRLGVNDVVLQIQADYDNKQLPEPERLLPVLDQLASDQKFIDIARERARTLAGRIRSSQ